MLRPSGAIAGCAMGSAAASAVSGVNASRVMTKRRTICMDGFPEADGTESRRDRDLWVRSATTLSYATPVSWRDVPGKIGPSRRDTPVARRGAELAPLLWPLRKPDKLGSTMALLKSGSPNAPLQRDRRGGIALLGGADEVQENVARGWPRAGFLRDRRLHARQVVRFRAVGPQARTCGPCVECLRGVTGFDRCLAAHESRIDEVTGHVRERRMVGRVGEHVRDTMRAGEIEILGAQEALVADLDHVAQRCSF